MNHSHIRTASLLTVLLLVGAGCNSKTTTTVETTVPKPFPAAESTTSVEEHPTTPASMDHSEQEGTSTDGQSGTSGEVKVDASADVNVGGGVNASAGAKATVQEFTVSGKSMLFEPSSIKVKKGDTVRITFKNTGGTHDFVIDEFNVASKLLKTGETDVIEFVADKAGSFKYYCSVGNHRAMGMEGTLVVE